MDFLKGFGPREREMPKSAGILTGVAVVGLLLVLESATCLAGIGQATASPAAVPGAPPAEPGKEIITLDDITIDKRTKDIRINAKGALAKGILEYLLVAERGKAYESAFKVSRSIPSQLNFALLLIGCEPLEAGKLDELSQRTDGFQLLLAEYPNSVLELEIFRDGEPIDPAEIITDREASAGPLTWVFTGSGFTRDGRYVADIELSFIALWLDEFAVVNLFSGRGNPYRGDFGFQMNAGSHEQIKDRDFEILIRRFSP